jgi:hypothetical protein
MTGQCVSIGQHQLLSGCIKISARVSGNLKIAMPYIFIGWVVIPHLNR